MKISVSELTTDWTWRSARD